MIPALSRIWEECFGDSPEYIRFFMERRFPTCQSFVWLEQGEAVGAIYLLPCYLQQKPAFYAYAGGVMPSYRRRGIFENLLACSKKLCEWNESALILVPAAGTEVYYQKRGFIPKFSYSQFSIKADMPDVGVEFRSVSPSQYERLRNKKFSALPYLQWDKDAIAYALAENEFCGGFAQIVFYEQEYLIFGKKNEKILEIMETTMSLELVKFLSGTLCSHWETEQISLRIPAMLEYKRREYGGMFGSSNFENGWLGLSLI